MNIAVIGSRRCSVDVNFLISQIDKSCTRIISGGSSGIDRLAAQASAVLGVELLEILPDYEKYGRSAPIRRNDEIIKNADCVLAFWDMHSPGTKYVIDRCIRKKVPVRVIPMEP